MKLIKKTVFKKGVETVTIKSYYDNNHNKMVSINARAFDTTFYRHYDVDNSDGSWYEYWVESHLADGYELVL